MFLFTTPASQEVNAAVKPVQSPQGKRAMTANVAAAVAYGAEKTNESFDHLARIAAVESGFNPTAKAATSSAKGLFQMTAQTWLGLLKNEGPSLGLDTLSEAIQRRPGGELRVDDPQVRQAILDLRNDPQLSAVMAGALTKQNRESLTQALGGQPSEADLYLAHFLGAQGAASLIQTARANPSKPAAQDFPDAAAANRSIFYTTEGRARSASEVYGLLAQRYSQAGGNIDAAPAFGPHRPLQAARDDGPVMFNLFKTEGRRGPVSQAVAGLWGGTPKVAAKPIEVASFFPKSSVAQQPASAADIPIQAARLDPLKALPAQPVQGANKTRKQASQPLDLHSFMTWRKSS